MGVHMDLLKSEVSEQEGESCPSGAVLSALIKLTLNFLFMFPCWEREDGG